MPQPQAMPEPEPTSDVEAYEVVQEAKNAESSWVSHRCKFGVRRFRISFGSVVSIREFRGCFVLLSIVHKLQFGGLGPWTSSFHPPPRVVKSGA